MYKYLQNVIPVLPVCCKGQRSIPQLGFRVHIKNNSTMIVTKLVDGTIAVVVYGGTVDSNSAVLASTATFTVNCTVKVLKHLERDK